MSTITLLAVTLSLIGMTLPGRSFAATVTEEPIPQLIRKARDSKSKKGREETIAAIAKSRPRTQQDVETLLDILTESAFAGASQTALKRLQPEDTNLVPPFVKALKSRDGETRIFAVEMVGKLKAKDAIPELRKISKGTTFGNIFRSDGGMLIGKALVSLGEIGDEESIPLMVSRLTKFGTNGGMAGIALQRMGKKAVLPLVSCAQEAKDEDTRRTCTYLIRGLRGKEAAPALLQVAKDMKHPRKLREHAIESLGYIADTDSLGELSKLFKSSSDHILKGRVLFAFKHAKNKDGIPLALEALRDKNNIVRASALDLLSEIGDERAVSALKEMLKDEDLETRVRAARALKKITGEDYDWKAHE